MNDKNGEYDKPVTAEERRIFFTWSYEENLRKVALGNLFLQKELEIGHDEHKKLRATIKATQESLERLSERAAPDTHQRSYPPGLAAFLLALIAPEKSAQALLGDLEEVFEKNIARFGERHARKIYWFEVARSMGPLLWRWVKRVGIFTFLVDYFRSKIGL